MFRIRKNWIKNVSRIGVAAIAAIFLSVASYANEEENPNPGAEREPANPVEFSRSGHLDVTARQRQLSWKVTEPDATKSLKIRLVKIANDTLKPVTIAKSSKPYGQFDLMKVGKGPGLYAILADSSDRNGEVSKSGMRFSYAELNPDCPDEKAWWASEDTVDYQTREQSKAKNDDGKFANAGNRNLVHLARHASHAVIANVQELVGCLTKEGSLFTYVVFNRVKTLSREGDSLEPEQLILRIPGGIAHGRVEIVSDAPIFQPEDQVLLFLPRDPQLHMPIVGGADSVYIIESDSQVRAYSGPNVVNVGDDFEIKLDPGYQLDAAHLRHYDPNMRPVIVPLKPQDGITKKARDSKVESLEAMPLESLVERISEAWKIADEVGRLPVKIDRSRRHPYNQLAQPKRKR